jgi:glycosyltransferase involved in cell wall biosynthesis
MISVIVPAYRAPTLADCVERLLSQVIEEQFEIIVCVSADTEADLPMLKPDPRLRVLASSSRVGAAAARNRAAAVSRGDALAFTDADAFAEPNWLSELARASAGKWCVAGAILNGTPDKWSGTAEYIVEFSDLHPDRPPQSLWHGATCNLLVPRSLWNELGPFWEDLDGGEDTALTVAAHRSGRLRFAPSARVSHQNRTRWSVIAKHQIYFGRFTARLARRSPYRARTLVRFSLLAPLAYIARVLSVYWRLSRCDRALFRRALVLFPAVVSLLGCWAWGLATEGARLDRQGLRPRSNRCPPT